MNEKILRKGILDAWVHLRKTNSDIPSEVLDWIKETCYKELERIKKTDKKPKEIKEPPKAHLEIGYVVAQIFNRKDHFQAFMDFGEKAMKEYADYVLHNEIIDSNNICKCKPDETTGATTWWVCNCCGRIQKDLK